MAHPRISRPVHSTEGHPRASERYLTASGHGVGRSLAWPISCRTTSPPYERFVFIPQAIHDRVLPWLGGPDFGIRRAVARALSVVSQAGRPRRRNVCPIVSSACHGHSWGILH